MPVNDAVELINMIPRAGYCEMRGGYAAHSYIANNTGVSSDGDGYLSAGNVAAFEVASADLTIEFWLRDTWESPAGGASQVCIAKIDKTNPEWEGYYIYYNNGLIATGFGDGVDIEAYSDQANSTKLPVDAKWHHVAVAFDQSESKVYTYMDGDLKFSYTYSTWAVTTTQNFIIGADWDGDTGTTGLEFDDVRVWSDIRTASEIRNNMSVELDGNEAGLVSYWKMNGAVGAGVATTIQDEVASNNDLTETGGSLTYVTGAFDLIADIDLCTEFYDGTNRQLLSASSSNIYNSTTAGAATSLGSGFTSGRWDTAMLGGIMGFVNGADTPQKYNGSTLSALTITGSGLTSTNLVGLHVYKSRSYFWENNSQNFWYSAVNTMGGAVTEFPLGDVAKKGGKLLRMESWTVDGGDGPDDYAVFIMDSGEVIVYQGDNPGDALYWGLVGKYTVGLPVNDRAILPLAGQILSVGENDLITMPSAFQTEVPPPTKLSGAIKEARNNLSSNDGWELFNYPNEDLLFINVPVTLTPDTFEQYVLNLQTGSACRFTGLQARTWGTYNGSAYFGSTDGNIYKFNAVEADAGSDINVKAVTAWANLGLPEYKQVTSARPTISHEDDIDYGIGVSYDYRQIEIASPSSSASGGTAWGSAWGSPWGSGTEDAYELGWEMICGRGSVLSVILRFARQGDRPKWYKTDLLVKREGNL